MIPTVLQDSLVEDLKNELKDFMLKNLKGERVNLNIYSQNLPAKKGQKDTAHFPYLLIRVEGGESQEEEISADFKSTCEIDFVIGVYDDDDTYQGYKDVMNIIDKIKYRLFSKRFYENQFEIDVPFKWIIHDEDTYPYYFGGIESHWKVPNINIDDDLI